MGTTLRRLAAVIAALPGRILRTFSWGHEYTDADDIDAERRREREVLRQGVDETDSPKAT